MQSERTIKISEIAFADLIKAKAINSANVEAALRPHILK
jgi:hypothetical protein